MTGGTDASGDDHCHRGDLRGLVADVEVGGVHVEVGELDVIQSAGAEGADGLIEPGADPGHLGLLDPRRSPKGVDQVVNGPGGDPVDVGLHHHRVQRLVDPSARLQDRREEAALAQLRDPQLDITSLGGQQPPPAAVAFGHSAVGAFVAGGADLLGRFDLDQLLHHQPHRIANEINSFAGTERVEQLGQDRLRQGHRCFSFSAYLAVHTENHADGPTTWWTPPATSNPTTPRDAYY